MCRAMPFSARALKENIFFDVDIVVKKHKNVKIEIWFIVVCTLIDKEYRHPSHILSQGNTPYFSIENMDSTHVK